MLYFIFGMIFAIVGYPTLHKIAELICIFFDWIIHSINHKISELVEPEETHVSQIGFVTDEDYDCWEDDEEE